MVLFFLACALSPPSGTDPGPDGADDTAVDGEDSAVDGGDTGLDEADTAVDGGDTAVVDTAVDSGGDTGSDTGASDGGALVGERGLASADALFVGAGEVGGAVTGADLDGDGLAEVAIGAALAEEGGAVGGAVYVVDGAASGTVDLFGWAPRVEGAATRDAVGSAVLAGDLDGDGTAELIVAGATSLPEARIFARPGGVRVFDAPDARVTWDEGILSTWALGDADDDGALDLLVGHRAGDGGALALVPGPVAGDVALADAAWTLADATETFGAVHVGDLDGDGVADLAVGMPGYTLLPWGDGWTAGASAGVAYVVLGPIAAPSFAEADAVLYASDVEDRVGAGLAGHDLDGDGAPELLVTGGGAVWSVPWAPGAARVADRATTTLGADGGVTGFDAGDLDGDGRVDVALGASGAGDDGVVGVLYGPLVGALDLSGADARVLGAPGGRFGGEVSVVPDMDGDGTAELLVRDSDNRGDFSGGVAALFYGGTR